MLSTTVTTATQSSVLPPSSVTVKVTLLVPRSLQSKAVWLATMLTMVPLSVLPPSMFAATMLALPLASSWIVMFWHTATGGFTSVTVTVALQVLVLPAASVTVSTTG